MQKNIGKLIEKGQFGESNFFKDTFHNIEDDVASKLDRWLLDNIVDALDYLDSREQLKQDKETFIQAARDFAAEGYILFFSDPQFVSSINTVSRTFFIVREEGTEFINIDSLKLSIKTGNEVIGS